MKKFLSNPTVAMILAVLVVIGTMLISTKVDFGKKCAQTSEKFYTRADAEAPIADRLRDFCTAAEKMVLLGQRYGIDDTDDAYEKAEEVLSSCDSRARKRKSCSRTTVNCCRTPLHWSLHWCAANSAKKIRRLIPRHSTMPQRRRLRSMLRPTIRRYAVS